MLVAVSGPLAGQMWPIREIPLVVGRGTTCDVPICDSLASRNHCILRFQGDTVLLEGREARNPVLVNGKPARTATLHVGDSLAIGSERFLLALHTSGPRADENTRAKDETVSLGDMLSVKLKSVSPGANSEVHLSTAEQLAFAFELTHRLSQCASREEALSLFAARLKDCLSPDAMWLARLRTGENSLYFRKLPGIPISDARPPSSKIIKMVLHENMATCTGIGGGVVSESIISSVIAPLALCGTSHGAIVVQRNNGQPAYSDADAHFLEALTRICTPLLHAAGVIEELHRVNIGLRKRAGESDRLVGESTVIRKLAATLEQVAQSNLNVIITGETGTGKELAARTLHRASQRADGPFVVVNCAAIPEELFESQMFGYRKGAFTGALESYEGLLSQADGGTLFLDEIGDLSLADQARILRAAETGTYRPVGAAEELEADVRMVTATNKDLLAMTREKTFREDLYHRLSGFEVVCPALREHSEDIPALARHFFEEARENARIPLECISQEALDELSRWDWRGNARELRACILRAVATATGPILQPGDFQGNRLSNHGGASESLDLASWERRHILDVLERFGGDVRSAAAALGIGRSTLYRKLVQLNIPH